MVFIQNQSHVVFEGRESVSIIQCEYQPSHYDQSLFAQLEIAYPASLNRAVSSRRAEFLAGRYAARQALIARHHSVSDISIGPDRCPNWPKGLAGSISHTDTHAFAAVADEKEYKYIGIDAEYVMDNQQAANIMSTVITPQELQVLCSCGFGVNLSVTLAFSMKESLFKALYPYAGTYFDFKDVEITGLCAAKMTVEIKVGRNVANAVQKNVQFKGYFKTFNSMFLTLIACEKSA